MNILVVIDMQNDFITGTLGSEQAQKIVPKVVDKVKHWSGEVFFTQDTHQEDYLETQEGRNLPVSHCIEGTEGWEICAELAEFVKREPILKESFGSLSLPEYVGAILRDVEEEDVTFTLVGLCTDICVIANGMILKAAFPEATVEVDASCCAGVTVESHENALAAMKMCQISVVS